MLERVLSLPTAAALAYQQAFAGSYTYAVLSVFWTLFTHLWYFMVLGPAVGVLLGRVVTQTRVHRALGGSGMGGAALAAGVGLASPACTFASLPVVGSLLVRGFPAIPLISFLVAAPVMNPSLFEITWGVRGSSMALARVGAAFLLAMTAAAAARVLGDRGWLPMDDLVRKQKRGESGTGQADCAPGGRGPDGGSCGRGAARRCP